MLRSMTPILCTFLCLLSPLNRVLAAYYDTLPKGVRMAVLKQVRTGTIDSAFDRQQQEQSNFFRVNLDAGSLENYNELTQSIFEQVRSISEEAYNEFSLGEYEAQGSANVQVNGAGLAYGLSNRLTLYGTFPWYKAQVNLQIERTKMSNNQKVVESLNATGNGTEAQILKDLAAQIPDINGGVVQSVVTNGFNYKPLGNWQAQGMGDMEIGAIYRLTDWAYSGLAVSAGVVLPTGRQDDPDILQDFAFGDGQTDVFAEFGGGFTIPNTRWSFDSFARFTYQFSHNRVMRVPESRESPYSAESMIFEEKLGNMLDLTTSATFQFKRWFGVSGAFLHRSIGLAEYRSPNEFANEIRALETNRTEQVVRAGINFSTVPLYQSGDFFLPFAANISAQQIVSGTNTPKYSRFDVEFRFYF